ncbi:hypothetical protein REPUB_Repub07fG0034100 [Reevesia pubescens]
MNKVLSLFCAASGEKVNLEKSKILVSSNINQRRARRLSAFCKIPLTQDFGKYLGAPMIHGRVTKQTYADIISRVQKRLLSWENKFLSLAGRTALIKSVLCSLPGYIMQTTYLPEYVIAEMDKLIKSFLWGGTKEERKMHLLNWEQISSPKEEGGLGVRNTRKTNLAYLAKLGWHLLINKDCLWVEIMEKKYLKGRDFLTVQSMGMNSYTWKSIIKGREILKVGLGMNVNNGETTKFWIDDWLAKGMLIGKAKRELTEEEVELHVKDYYTENRGWDIDRLCALLDQEYIDKIQARWIDTSTTIEDTIYWRLDADGDFSVKSAYKCQLLKYDQCSFSWDSIWDMKCPPKIKMLLWKILHGVLPTKTFLAHRNISSEIDCPRCSNSEETTLHVLRDCPNAKMVWLSINPTLNAGFFLNSCITEWILENVQSKKEIASLAWSLLFAVTTWFLWFWRNMCSHNADFLWPSNAYQQIWSKTKEITDVMMSFSSRLKYEARIHWIKPSTGEVKMNVDGSFNGHSNIATAGGLLRDDNGNWIFGFTYKIGTTSVLGAEL